MFQTDDVKIKKIKELLPPVAVLEKFPATETASSTTFQAREAIHNMLQDKDDRLLVVIGPCSIHDPKAAIEYGQRLKALRDELSGQLEIVMRVYFEKPRTTVGWKGLINDPYLNDTYEINDGLRMGRKLLLDLTDMGMPTASEFLDMITPQYVADLISWGAIGARTTESQVHRELASGLSCPVGFKTVPMATLKSRLMRFALLVPLTTSCLLPSLVIRRLSKPQVTQIATLFCVAVKNPTTARRT